MHIMVDPPTFDPQVQIQNMVVKAFAKFDGLQNDPPHQNPLDGPPLDNNIAPMDALDNETQTKVLMETLFAKATTTFYEGFQTSVLSMLLNLSIVHGIANIFMDELFALL
jgi:hypothetical protein